MAVAETVLTFALEQLAGSAFKSLIAKLMNETAGLDDRERFMKILERLSAHDKFFADLDARLVELESIVRSTLAERSVRVPTSTYGVYFHSITGGQNAFRDSLARRKG
jgi:hypothetical protein